MCILFGFNIVFNNLSVISRQWELNALFYSAASLWYQVLDTLLHTTPSHITLTPGRPVLALHQNLSAKLGATTTIVNAFGMSRPGIEPDTSRPRSGHYLQYCATEGGHILGDLPDGYSEGSYKLSMLSVLVTCSLSPTPGLNKITVDSLKYEKPICRPIIMCKI